MTQVELSLGALADNGQVLTLTNMKPEKHMHMPRKNENFLQVFYILVSYQTMKVGPQSCYHQSFKQVPPSQI